MDPQTITEIQKNTQELLNLLDIESDVVVEVDESAVIQVKIKQPEDEGGILIGYRGENLRALQLLLSMLVNQGREDWLRITVDIDGYRDRREEQLVALAKRMAEKVSYLKEPIALSPMPSSDRRIVHMAIAELDGVRSESTGEGRQRKVIVSPA